MNIQRHSQMVTRSHIANPNHTPAACNGPEHHELILYPAVHTRSP